MVPEASGREVPIVWGSGRALAVRPPDDEVETPVAEVEHLESERVGERPQGRRAMAAVQHEPADPERVGVLEHLGRERAGEATAPPVPRRGAMSSSGSSAVAAATLARPTNACSLSVGGEVDARHRRDQTAHERRRRFPGNLRPCRLK